MVWEGRVRELEVVGNDLADEAPDFGRRRVDVEVIDARRGCVCACMTWYLVVRDLHRFFVAVSRATVNDDGEEGYCPRPCCLVVLGLSPAADGN